MATVRLEEELGCASFTFLSSPINRTALLIPKGFTPAQSRWEWVKDRSPSFIACLYMPGSYLHFSDSVKGPVIYCCFKVPPACQSDVKGLLVDSGSGLCLGLASSLSSGGVYLCWGIYAGGKSQATLG